MFEGKTVAVVVPCHNERTQIERVVRTMPKFVDRMIVVDDASTDGTAAVVRRLIEAEGQAPRTVLVERHVNEGPGAAVVAGYQEALRRGIDVIAVMDGDGQMDPGELHLLVGPVARGEADYSKGNRLFYEKAWETTPKHRYLGNALLSMLTKIASGYWHVADSQTAYTAISREALGFIHLESVYTGYGYPNDLLVRLNVFDMRVANVPIRPIYRVGEVSSMRLWKVIPTISWLILKRFLWRMGEKYIVHDFHPLVLFYAAAASFALAAAVLFVRLVWVWVATGRIPAMNAILWTMCVITSIQLGLFAMWFDMERNRHLRVAVRRGNGRPPPPADPPGKKGTPDEGKG